VDLSPDGVWRRLLPPTPHDVVKGGDNFQFLAGSYLCSVGLVVLNRRHLAGHAELEDARPLVDFMIRVADEAFADLYLSESPGTAYPAKRYRLKRSELVDSMPGRAVWVLQKWDKRKVEGRRRGGRHSAAEGVRKGPPPRLYPFMIANFMHLTAGERRKAFMAEHKCAASTYYELQRRYLDRLASPVSHDVLDQAELMKLLPVDEEPLTEC
jgi:hypothetical protein